MSEIYELFRRNRRCNNKIKRFCEPLFNNFGFNGFFYHHIAANGYATSCSSDIESFEYYYHSQLYKLNPYARHPDHFQNSIHFIPDVKDDAYQNTIQCEADKFGMSYQLVILEKTEMGCQGFSFAISQKNQSVSYSYIINHLPILQTFIRHLKLENTRLFENLLSEPYHLEKEIGKEFKSKPQILTAVPSDQNKIQLLKQMGILNSADEVLLSRRELECIKLLIKGHTSAQTSEILKLSKRTVEHYIENIKLKTNCFTKLELFEKFRELEVLGLLK